jgi:predicted phage terminase large subunit-like protein
LLHIFRKRLLYPELRKQIILGAAHFRASAVLIEDKASGTALAQDLRNGELGTAGRPITIEPEGDKITRASAQSLLIENGRVFLPQEASWLSELHKEIVQFPYGRFDDQIDSISQFLQWASRPVTRVQFVRLGGY